VLSKPATMPRSQGQAGKGRAARLHNAPHGRDRRCGQTLTPATGLYCLSTLMSAASSQRGKMKKIIGPVILVLAFLPMSTLGQTSQQYALMGHKLWAAFECAALADVAGTREGQRLFDIGYTQGRVFVEAVQAGKVAEQDINEKVPLAVLPLLHGPTVDFILGRIFEAAIDDVTKDIPLNEPDENEKKIVAQSKYAKMNCSLM
jgi:hypothetical protein